MTPSTTDLGDTRTYCFPLGLNSNQKNSKAHRQVISIYISLSKVFFKGLLLNQHCFSEIYKGEKMDEQGKKETAL